jgi:choline dehydrogenase-like flavoprotein
MKSYDAIIVGAGAGGGIVAALLAEAGHKVLLIERGPNLSFSDVGRDHLRSQRLSAYGHNAGPDIHGNPRVIVSNDGHEHVVRPHEGGYQNNAACVGGGTRVYGAQAWRFMPQDFRMASIYGVPAGSSLADWPLSYEELEPYYERAEWELGCSGDSDAMVFHGPRRRGYPMPPLPETRKTEPLKRGAAALGWKTNPVPLLINSQPYDGRGACIGCNNCVGFACAVEAKNGTQNTMIPRALQSGNCELLAGTMTERVETDGRGNVIGVTLLREENGTFSRETVCAKIVVLAAGAIETARLLLNSAGELHPHGLGNEHDQVGRHLQGHYYAGARGVVEEEIYDGIGPGVTISTCQFNHGNDGVIGGAMLADDFLKPPIDFWHTSLPPDLPKWGQEAKDWMRKYFHRTLYVAGPVQEIPHPDGRVQVSGNVCDKYGIPVARLSGTTHESTLDVAEFIAERAREWLQASGASKIWSAPQSLRLSGGQHQAGTCRMGDDPQTSVTDKWGRVHAHDNLFVADGSLHVTNGGFNPVLTIMALAFRSGEHLARHLK